MTHSIDKQVGLDDNCQDDFEDHLGQNISPDRLESSVNSKKCDDVVSVVFAKTISIPDMVIRQILSFTGKDLHAIIFKSSFKEFLPGRLPLSILFDMHYYNRVDFGNILESSRFKYRLCDYLASKGLISYLEWAINKGFHCSSEICYLATERGHLDVLQYLVQFPSLHWKKKTAYIAATKGHIHILDWAIKHGCNWQPRTLSDAAYYGQLHVLQWAQEVRLFGHFILGFEAAICMSAAAGGQLEVLQWLRSQGYPWGDLLCANAAINGHQHIIEWAIANGCQWDRETCSGAAAGDQLELLQWLIARGCPWDNQVCYWARVRGNQALLDWALENGCPPYEGPLGQATTLLHLGRQDLGGYK